MSAKIRQGNLVSRIIFVSYGIIRFRIISEADPLVLKSCYNTAHSGRLRSLNDSRYNLLCYFCRHLYRYHAVLLRARFDENKDEFDMVKAKQLLADGEEELFLKRHPQPFKCKHHYYTIHRLHYILYSILVIQNNNYDTTCWNTHKQYNAHNKIQWL